MSQFLYKVLFISLSIKNTFEQFTNFKDLICDDIQSRKTCRFSKIDLRSIDHDRSVNIYHIFQDEITNVEFANSRIFVWTSIFCDTFTNIETCISKSLGLKSIDDNAFYSCKSLKILDLSENDLTVLPSNMFIFNSALIQLDLSSNKLTQIDVHLFENTSLAILFLKDNGITEFNEMPFAPSLLHIYLQMNRLMDINVQNLLHNYLNLELIFFSNNYIPCDREREICKQLSQEQINCEGTKLCSLIDEIFVTQTRLPTTRVIPTRANHVSLTTPIKPDSDNSKQSDADIKKNISDLQQQHQISNLVIIVISTILVLLLLGLGIGWIVRRSKEAPVVHEVAQKETNKLEDANYIDPEDIIDDSPLDLPSQCPMGQTYRDDCRTNQPQVPPRENKVVHVHGRVSRNDPYYEYVPGFGDLNNEQPIYEVPSMSNHGSEMYDRLNFNQYKN